jgi:glyoxylase-like metal-dependent hydrolase (beta-lactamase superfamily II)
MRRRSDKGEGVQEWKIGDVRVRAAVEVAVPVPAAAMVAELTLESAAEHLGWLQPDYVDADGNILLAVQSFLVESGDRRIVVDTCFGHGHALPYDLGLDTRHHPTTLADAGFGRDDVDVVVCTHLHLDHVGWNVIQTEHGWEPMFPNAQYLFGSEEYDHWQGESDPNKANDESVQLLVDAGLARLVANDHEITPEVRLVPTPGHTPGHVSVRIDSGGRSALISGDMVHHPVQIARPDWPSVPDFDPEAAMAMRRTTFGALADTDVLLLGTHFNAPTGGYVRSTGAGWTWSAHKG